jgi:hypothetical protein
MIRIPFKRDGFASGMKPKISGNNLSLEYDNIESSLMKVGADITHTLPQKFIDRLIDKYSAGNVPEPDATALDYLQRAMLHFAVYEHLIFLITRIGNDGVTVKKNDDETTAYKYQVDELNNKLITTAWFWMNLLIRFLNDRPDDFPEWKESEQKKALDELPVNLSDFNRWVGVAPGGGEYFMICAGWIIREVWIDCVRSRFPNRSELTWITRWAKTTAHSRINTSGKRFPEYSCKKRKHIGMLLTLKSRNGKRKKTGRMPAIAQYSASKISRTGIIFILHENNPTQPIIGRTSRLLGRFILPGKDFYFRNPVGTVCRYTLSGDSPIENAYRIYRLQTIVGTNRPGSIEKRCGTARNYQFQSAETVGRVEFCFHG